jgi:hypothetical protein
VLENWGLTDIMATAAGAVAVAYMFFEISRRQQALRDLFNVLDGEDAGLTAELERLVETGALQPFAASGVA